MAVQIIITIPGSATTPGDPAYRLKEALDWQYRRDPENAPSTAAEYKAIVEDALVGYVKSWVLAQEQDKRYSELSDLPDIIIEKT